jgi:hypothetical protein
MKKRQGLITFLTAATFGAYSLFGTNVSHSQNYQDYNPNDPVYMIHKGIADRDSSILRDPILNHGGVETLVATDDTVYVEKKIFFEKEKTSIAKEEKWYDKPVLGINGITAKRFGIASLITTGVYLISDQVSKHNDKHHTHKPQSNDDEEGVQGNGRTDEGSTGTPNVQGGNNGGSMGGGRTE